MVASQYFFLGGRHPFSSNETLQPAIIPIRNGCISIFFTESLQELKDTLRDFRKAAEIFLKACYMHFSCTDRLQYA